MKLGYCRASPIQQGLGREGDHSVSITAKDTGARTNSTIRKPLPTVQQEKWQVDSKTK